MDEFEKLGRLVGVAVEAAPGEGLPRTRAEAMALGLPRYFTGKPCRHGHVAERLVSARSCCDCDRLRLSSLGYKERRRQHRAKPETKESRRQYRAKPEVRERDRQYSLKRTGDAILFSINQAGMAAVSSRAPTDIVPQCPEPQRSQLQALIDRIRADPTAGKAVIGLLRTMRELRKAELAQQRADIEATAAESNT